MAQQARSKKLIAEIGELVDQKRGITAKSLEIAQVPIREFRPLLVEDDQNQAFLLGICFRKLGLPHPLPVMGDVDQAMAYLTGRAKYKDRSKYPLPTLVISDLHLPGKTGMELLRWMSSQPTLTDLIFFMLTSSVLAEDREEALRSGADDYFTKPMGLTDFMEVSRLLALRWGRLYRALTSKRSSP